MDFVSDALSNGRRLCALMVVNAYTRRETSRAVLWTSKQHSRILRPIAVRRSGLGMKQQPLMFEARFLDKHAGEIISSTTIAIVELVANTWDAYATKVDITWPDASRNVSFSI